jgi:hypothetical protein
MHVLHERPLRSLQPPAPFFPWENFLCPLSSFPGLTPYPKEKGEMLIK